MERPLTDRAYHRVLATATRLAVEPVLGVRFVSRARWIEKWWQRPEEQREAWRAEALRSMLAYCSTKVPAFSELPANGDIDLTELAVIDKQMIIGEPDAYLSIDHERLPAVEKHTGGSTGDPWNYPLDRVAWAESYAIQIHRFEQLGVAYGDRRVTLGFPTSLGLQGMGAQKRLRLAAERTDVSLCGFEVDRETSLNRAIKASAMGASMWYGYASTIAAMASAALEARLSLPGPRLIVTMAEPLWPNWKDDIDAAFGSRVVEEYGCNDGGIMAHRCAAGLLHLADHQSVVEVLDDDGQPCPEGAEGDVVITNLHARHMPFLRYLVGDRGILGPRHCPCGQPGRTLAAVTGRSGDFVLLPDGTELSPVTFFNPFNEVDGVRRWQIVQSTTDAIIIRIDPRPEWNDSEGQLIREWVEDQTRHQLRVEITTDQPLEITSGGKHKIIVRRSP